MNPLLQPLAYPVGLAVLSVLVAMMERIRPWRPAQGFVRPRLGWDLLSLVLNAHFTGVALAMVAAVVIQPWLPTLVSPLPTGLAKDWPWWVQVPAALVIIDFIQWSVHRGLHAWPWLWEFHKVHHSIEAGEMDWVGSFRFHWMEPVLYGSVQYLPLLLLGFAPEAMMFHALFGTAVGHLNHSNLDLGHGSWRYVLNSPRMHLWHHSRETQNINFGIIFSAWDWLFGTAHLPEHAPTQLGFAGMDTFPRTLPGQWLWPLRIPGGVLRWRRGARPA
jgi:sterol desaturase/sphingolipid hydroxylase (fatty acid hydroxylase superfamily)